MSVTCYRDFLNSLSFFFFSIFEVTTMKSSERENKDTKIFQTYELGGRRGGQK